MSAYPYTWIDSDQALLQCCKTLQQAEVLALDTEFMRSTTFFPKAALFQVSDGQHHYLIDPLAIVDFQPLIDLLINPNVIKVFHSCSEDLEVIQYFLECVPQPLIDTQIAAALLNIGSAVGYANVVKQVLDKELPKGETRSDWLQRPLQDKQITYAVQDVAYLLALYHRLITRLQSLDRIPWLREECQVLIENAQHPPSLEDYYLKIRSAWKLNRRQLAVLKALATWREKKARTLDMPRNHIVHAKALMELALRNTVNAEALGQLENLKRRQRQQFGREIIEIVETAQTLADTELPPALPRPLSSEQKKLSNALKARADDIAAEYQLPPDILVKKQDIEDFIRGEQNGQWQLPPRLRGWRKVIVGDALVERAVQWRQSPQGTR